ncbi:MAG: hypothetical protein NVSMB62_13190 [Acidobacteriaceae bacterium]
MPQPVSAFRDLLVLASLTALISCSSSGSYSGQSTSTVTTVTPKAATNVYVIQNPTNFGVGSGAILQFSATATGNVTPGNTIAAPTGASFNAIATDGTGNLYVSTSSPKSEDVREYAAGSTTASRILPGTTTTRIGAVDSIAVSATGEIFVAEDSGGVAAFGAASTGDVAPARYILGSSQTGGGLSTIVVANSIAADSSNNLYISNIGAPGLTPIIVFGSTATGNVAPVRAIGGPLTTLGAVGGLATDASSNLYVSSNTIVGKTVSGKILVFGPSATGNIAPIRQISGDATQLGPVFGIAVDPAGNIYVISATTTAMVPTVFKFSSTASGNVAPISSFTSTTWTNPDNSASIAVY